MLIFRKLSAALVSNYTNTHKLLSITLVVQSNRNLLTPSPCLPPMQVQMKRQFQMKRKQRTTRPFPLLCPGRTKETAVPTLKSPKAPLFHPTTSLVFIYEISCSSTMQPGRERKSALLTMAHTYLVHPQNVDQIRKQGDP